MKCSIWAKRPLTSQLAVVNVVGWGSPDSWQMEESVINDHFISSSLYCNQHHKTEIYQNIQMTDHVDPLETFQSHNEIKDSICASNDYHSVRYWPLLAGNNGALSSSSAIQCVIYFSCFFMKGKIVGRLLKRGIYFSAGSLARFPFFSPSGFSSEEIETFHLRETGAIKLRWL